MINVEYCTDGYNLVRVEISSFGDLKKQLTEIQDATKDVYSCPFSADVVIADIGRISIGLAEQTVLCYCSADFNKQLTAVGDMSAEGSVMFYFGDYSIMSAKYVVPYSLALEILEYWIMTGKLSDMVEWTGEILNNATVPLSYI